MAQRPSAVPLRQPNRTSLNVVNLKTVAACGVSPRMGRRVESRRAGTEPVVPGDARCRPGGAEEAPPRVQARRQRSLLGPSGAAILCVPPPRVPLGPSGPRSTRGYSPRPRRGRRSRHGPQAPAMQAVSDEPLPSVLVALQSFAPGSPGTALRGRVQIEIEHVVAVGRAGAQRAAKELG